MYDEDFIEFVQKENVYFDNDAPNTYGEDEYYLSFVYRPDDETQFSEVVRFNIVAEKKTTNALLFDVIKCTASKKRSGLENLKMVYGIFEEIVAHYGDVFVFQVSIDLADRCVHHARLSLQVNEENCLDSGTGMGFFLSVADKRAFAMRFGHMCDNLYLAYFVAHGGRSPVQELTLPAKMVQTVLDSEIVAGRNRMIQFCQKKVDIGEESVKLFVALGLLDPVALEVEKEMSKRRPATKGATKEEKAQYAAVVAKMQPFFAVIRKTNHEELYQAVYRTILGGAAEDVSVANMNLCLNSVARLAADIKVNKQIAKYVRRMTSESLRVPVVVPRVVDNDLKPTIPLYKAYLKDVAKEASVKKRIQDGRVDRNKLRSEKFIFGDDNVMDADVKKLKQYIVFAELYDSLALPREDYIETVRKKKRFSTKLRNVLEQYRRTTSKQR